ncbi:hypothetical protein PCANC_10728 [Puccinia coronata f. sp. avenae]|uniref:Uncharacterized protein n=1 Tax=Puccinia coronata f. sp. avenae TaxID=200324 RepID=A0A2N5VSW4_9BASI|nr:hypothetical protein PCANC_10728 [Puccinia coronata f. sp. avenae]
MNNQHQAMRRMRPDMRFRIRQDPSHPHQWQQRQLGHKTNTVGVKAAGATLPLNVCSESRPTGTSMYFPPRSPSVLMGMESSSRSPELKSLPSPPAEDRVSQQAASPASDSRGVPPPCLPSVSPKSKPALPSGPPNGLPPPPNSFDQHKAISPSNLVSSLPTTGTLHSQALIIGNPHLIKAYPGSITRSTEPCHTLVPAGLQAAASSSPSSPAPKWMSELRARPICLLD